MTGSESTRELLSAGLQELSMHVAPEQVDQLLQLAQLLQEWASRINLTGHRTLEAIVERLILEALALEAQMPAVQTLADLGSGAGFPGLPIAILRPDRQVTLVESRLRRHHFQRAALRALGLTNVTAVLGRVEELDPRAHEGAVAQAMAKPGRVVGLMLPWVEVGGWVMVPGAASVPEIPPTEGLELDRCVRYSAPLSGIARTLWIGHREPK